MLVSTKKIMKTLKFEMFVVVDKMIALTIVATSDSVKFIESFAQVMLLVLLGAVLMRLNSLPSVVMAVALMVFDAVRSIKPMTMLIAMTRVSPRLLVLIADRI